MPRSKIKKIYPHYVPFSLLQAAIIVSVLVCLVVLQQYIHHTLSGYTFSFSWRTVLLRNIVNYSLLLTVVPLIGLLLKTNRGGAFKWALFVPSILLLTIVHQSLSLLIFDFIYVIPSLGDFSFLRPQNKVALSAGLLSSLLQILAVGAIIWGKSYYDRYTIQTEDLARSELRALKMQLQPHFLFNTLNSITSLIDIDTKKAQKMLTQLGYLMREILEYDSKYFIPLSEELKYIKTYLEIEHVRFSDRLKLDFDIADNLNNVKIPSLITQPLVENAIKHGIARCPDGGTVSIKALRTFSNHKEYLDMEFINDTITKNGNKNHQGYGIGTVNVKERLAHCYGVDFSYSLAQHQNKYIAKISIPLERVT